MKDVVRIYRAPSGDELFVAKAGDVPAAGGLPGYEVFGIYKHIPCGGFKRATLGNFPKAVAVAKLEKLARKFSGVEVNRFSL